MSTTLGWIFWTIGIFTIFGGMILTLSLKDKRMLNGWLLMSIGLVFNAGACIAEHKTAMLIVSILVACWDFNLYLKKKKECELKKLKSKEEFLDSINKYKNKKV